MAGMARAVPQGPATMDRLQAAKKKAAAQARGWFADPERVPKTKLTSTTIAKTTETNTVPETSPTENNSRLRAETE